MKPAKGTQGLLLGDSQGSPRKLLPSTSAMTSIPHPHLQTEGLTPRTVTCFSALPLANWLTQAVWLSVPLQVESRAVLTQPCAPPTPEPLIQPGQALVVFQDTPPRCTPHGSPHGGHSIWDDNGKVAPISFLWEGVVSLCNRLGQRRGAQQRATGERCLIISL